MLLGESEGKRPVGTPRPNCEDDIKMDIKDAGLLK
jgi:hypothetical protein